MTPVRRRAASPTHGAIRRWLHAFHLYVGVTAGLLVVMAGLSGSALVFRDEIEAQAHPERFFSTLDGARVSLDAVMQSVSNAFPDDRPFTIRMPRAPNETYLVKLNGAHDRFVYVDPHSGNIVGTQRQIDSVLGWIDLLHTELLAGDAGKTVLGIAALLLSGLCLTGLVLWWPRNGRIGQGLAVRWSARGKRLNFDLHRVSGIYASLFLLLTALTGAAFVFDKAASRLVNAFTASAPRAAAPRVEPPGAAPRPLSLDLLVERANRALNAPTLWISLPQNPHAPLVLRKKMPQEFHPNGRSFVYVDPFSGRVLQVSPARSAPLGTRIVDLFYPLHVGAIGGTTTRIVQGVVGVVPTLLMITGVVMWAQRRKRR